MEIRFIYFVCYGVNPSPHPFHSTFHWYDPISFDRACRANTGAVWNQKRDRADCCCPHPNNCALVLHKHARLVNWDNRNPKLPMRKDCCA
jgi:hypothetical protein